MWNDLTITHEGTSQFKRPKINLFRSHYENYYMINSETIAEILTCFTKITNELSSLGDVIDHDRKVRKEIRALFKVWEIKATTLRELNDERRWISLNSFGISKLMRWKWRFEKIENPKRKRASRLRWLHIYRKIRSPWMKVKKKTLPCL